MPILVLSSPLLAFLEILLRIIELNGATATFEETLSPMRSTAINGTVCNVVSYLSFEATKFTVRANLTGCTPIIQISDWTIQNHLWSLSSGARLVLYLKFRLQPN